MRFKICQLTSSSHLTAYLSLVNSITKLPNIARAKIMYLKQQLRKIKETTNHFYYSTISKLYTLSPLILMKLIQF